MRFLDARVGALHGTALFALFLLFSLSPSGASALPAGKKPPTVVQTDLGPIEGVYEPLTDLVAFYGIPFAAPPVGDLRLRPPVAPQHWTKTRNCKEDKYFQICPQFPFLKRDFVGKRAARRKKPSFVVFLFCLSLHLPCPPSHALPCKPPQARRTACT